MSLKLHWAHFLLFVKTGILESPDKSDQYYDEDIKIKTLFCKPLSRIRYFWLIQMADKAYCPKSVVSNPWDARVTSRYKYLRAT
jgi:hypothetical protein